MNVAELLLTWERILLARDHLIKSAAGLGRHAATARCQLADLDAALESYVAARPGVDRLRSIHHKWCGQSLVDAVEAAETLVAAFHSYALGSTRHNKRARPLKSVRTKQGKGLRAFDPSELMKLYADEVEHFAVTVGTTISKVRSALNRPEIQLVFKEHGERSAALLLLGRFGFGSRATAYRHLKLRAGVERDLFVASKVR
jgi:hypothetical protein